MLKHGYSGVAEIEHHVTNTFGWSASTGAVDNWVYGEIAQTYVLDQSMLDRLRSLNGHATRQLCTRLLEASGRGYWDAEEAVVGRLREVVSSIEDEIEGIGHAGAATSGAMG
jgi:magnesium chelatase subunit H